jgi:hypothetical protein
MMDISEFYPEAKTLIRAEVGVLDYLRENPYIRREQSQFAMDAGRWYGKCKSAGSGFAFASHVDVWHSPMGARDVGRSRQGKRRCNVRMTIAAKIKLDENGKYDDVSYCLCICRLRAKSLPILRKFHFDVAIKRDNQGARTQEHPICHLQYGGEMIPYMETIGLRPQQLEKMYPWLSEPRIFCWPMSLALLVDMAFHEFPDQRSTAFRASSEWRALIREHETLVLRPFYEKCVEVIADKRKLHRTLSDAFYIT